MKYNKLNTSEDIRRELDALARGDKRTWSQISALLQAVEDTDYWKDESSSFTEWILRKTALFGVKQASLWRYLGAGRTYLYISQSLRRKGDRFPALRDLPESVSPENLELLSKISRAIPETDQRELFAGILNGNLRRSSLRALWDDYRPTLEGRTARGRNVPPPRVDPKELRALGALFEAKTLDALRSKGPSWTGVSEPEKFGFFTKVRAPHPVRNGSIIVFDAVAVVKPRNQVVQYHGIAVGSPMEKHPEGLPDLINEIPFFDYYWIAVPASTETRISDKLLSHVGVLLVDEGTVVVHRYPGRVPHEKNKADGRLVLASALLLRTLR